MAGSGEPVYVLLHGFAASLYSWLNVMPELARQGTVIAFDRPAFGLTERPLKWDGQNPYSSEFAADLTIGLVDRLGVRKAILVVIPDCGHVPQEECPIAFLDSVREFMKNIQE